MCLALAGEFHRWATRQVQPAKLATEIVQSRIKRKIGMAAYVIVNVDITDPMAYPEYTKLVPPTIAAYGGEFLVRGGKVETMEGVWAPKRLVVIKFENAARAKQWLDSEEYRPVRAMRHQAATSQLIIVEGV